MRERGSVLRLSPRDRAPSAGDTASSPQPPPSMAENRGGECHENFIQGPAKPAPPPPRRILSTLALVLSALAGGLLAAPEVHAQNTIVDASAKEGSKVTFVITVTGFTTRDNDVRYSYRTKDGTAEAGKDYNSADSYVTFTPNNPRVGVNIVTIADDVEEGNETFELELYDRKVKGEYPGDTTWRTSSTTYPRAGKLTMTGRIVDQ